MHQDDHESCAYSLCRSTELQHQIELASIASMRSPPITTCIEPYIEHIPHMHFASAYKDTMHENCTVYVYVDNLYQASVPFSLANQTLTSTFFKSL